GASWASEQTAGGFAPQATPEERQAVLQTLQRLAPARGSRIEAISFAGRLVGADRVIELGRDARTRISRELQPGAEIEPVFTEGTIRSVDLDRRECMLRERADGGPDVLCAYGEIDEDTVKLALDERVLVYGTPAPTKSRTPRIEVELVEPANGPGDDATA